MKHFRVLLVLTLIVFSLTLASSFATDNTSGKILILYYSLTGKTKLACETLQEPLGAALMEIKDLKDRSGRWGFFTGAITSLFGMQTDIAPEHPDLSSYPCIILASPIWTGKLSPAIRTLIAKNRFDGKKVIIFTTTNAFEKEEAKEKAKALVAAQGGKALAYYQVTSMNKVNDKKIERTNEEIIADTLKFVPEIQKVLSSQK